VLPVLVVAKLLEEVGAGLSQLVDVVPTPKSSVNTHSTTTRSEPRTHTCPPLKVLLLRMPICTCYPAAHFESVCTCACFDALIKRVCA